MSQRRDIPKLKRMVSLSDVAGRVMDVRPNGAEFKGLCPFHNENNPSFTIYDGDNGFQLYACHGCDEKGDIIDFMQKTQGLSKSDAIKELERMAGGGDISSTNNAQRVDIERAPKATPGWVSCDSPGDALAPKSLSINRDGVWVEATVVGAWAYRNTAGALLGFTCRVEWEGKKDVIPVSWKMNTRTGEIKLRQGAFAVPRSLYGAELLAADPKKFVVLVEGEKTADAGRRIFGINAIVITWPGGCKAVDKADWSLIAGRKVLLWPDCDSQGYGESHPLAGELKPYHEQPGMAAMLKASEILTGLGCDCRIVRVPEPGAEWPSGHDLADLESAGWDWAKTFEYFSTRRATAADIVPAATEELPDGYVGGYDDSYQPEYYEYGSSGPDNADDQSEILSPVVAAQTPIFDGPMPFQNLGVSNGRYYYLPDGVSQVIALTPAQHTKLNLYHLAPKDFWKGTYVATKKGGDGVDWDQAVDTIMRLCEKEGIYDPERIRGRGAWWDSGKWAVHLGNRVVMAAGDEQPIDYPLRGVPSRYIYEAGKKIDISIDDPLSTVDAYELVKILQRLRWERPINAKLLAGYIFLAPVCGAIEWRPHVHITGGAGSGKSTVMTKIVGCCLEGIGLKAEGDTSEAGLRQALAHDARPVIFDEFESERKKAAERVDDVMSMVTRSSSETGAQLLKGGADGKHQSYKSRAMFIFASIGVNIRQHAARTRISVLGLVSRPETPESLEEFKDLSRHITEVLTPAYVAKLQARAVRMIPIIRKNCQVFSEAAALHLSDRRLGDQVGTLLAGAYGLHSSNVITMEMAKEFIEGETWDEVEETKADNDEAKLISHLLSKITRVEVATGMPRSRNIASLLARAGKLEKDDEVTEREASQHLQRLGIKVASPKLGWDPYVLFANGHGEIKAMLRDTPWEHSYERTLLRMDDAEKHSPTNIGGVSPRSTKIPLWAVLNNVAGEDD